MKLVYDISSCPTGLDVANFTKIFEQHHIVFWDSTKGGTKPKLYSDQDQDLELSIVDMEGKEFDIEMYSKEFRDKEFWERELHYCKNSPIYYFSNYLTPVYPASSTSISEYLVSLGLSELSAKDSDTATEVWEAQKARVKEVSESITIEQLQEKRGVMEVLRATYEKQVSVYEDYLKDKVALFDVDKSPLPNKTRVINLVNKIRSTKIVPEKYQEAYKNIRGRWDGPVLHATSYDVLLAICFYTLTTKK